MRKLTTIGVLLALAAAATALTGNGGYGADLLFTATDLQESVEYDSGFAGAEWADLSFFALGSPSGTAGFTQSQDAAGDGNGNLYLIVHGWDTVLNPTWTGLVLHDGTGFRNLVQDATVKTGGTVFERVGDMIRNVAVSPATAGKLTAGDPVIVRHHKVIETEVELEIWSVDPTTAPASETFVYGWTTPAVNAEGLIAIDGDGVIFVLEAGLEDDAGVAGLGTIRRLEWNGSSYDETILDSHDARGGILVGADGYIYTCDPFGAWSSGTRSADRTVYRLDPDSGVASSHAAIEGYAVVHDWTLDSEGGTFVGMRELGKKADAHYVSELIAGEKLSKRDRISDSSNDPDALASGPDGTIYVIEGLRDATGAVFLLTPGDGGGDGGKGGGGSNGGGKGGGRNK